MDGNTQPDRIGWDDLDSYAHAHPEIDVSQVEGVYRAWVPIGDNGGGAELHGRTEDELLGKLVVVAGW